MENIVYNLKNINQAVELILIKSISNLVCFRGEIGAGKTTIIKAVINKLGAADRGSSPSFGLVNEYHDASGTLVAYHLDCYRLESEEEALGIGIEEYLEAECWVFVEWPGRIPSLLPDNRTEISLTTHGPDSRNLQLQNLSL